MSGAPAGAGSAGAALDGQVLLGVDVGGTFTDAVLLAGGRAWAAKSPTTPEQEQGVLAAVEAVLADAGIEPAAVTRFAQGTTVATNALLERRGARVVALLTEACVDLLELGRQQRPRLFELQAQPVRPPVEAAIAVRERMVPGAVRTPLDADELQRVVDEVVLAEPDAVAICLLHAWQDPSHERALASALRERCPSLTVVASSELSRELREYERASTTVLDAYLTPVLGPYLRRLSVASRKRGLPQPLVMQSDGGLDELEAVAAHAAKAVLSGPAGGLVAAGRLLPQLEVGGLLCIDVGGTSSDVATLGSADIERAALRQVDGLPLQLHAVDIHTVGAGGSSIASVDAAGALHVGPGSAGSVPGPACYGRGGTSPTVTDAQLVRGVLHAGSMEHWGVRLDVDAARRALATLDPDVEAAAAAVVRLAVTNMAEAARVVSVARGLEPRELALFAFGGAGGMHACEAADQLGCELVAVPVLGGVLSAAGLAVADVRRHRSRSTRVRPALAGDGPALDALVRELAGELRALSSELAAHGAARLELSCSLRYAGQAHAIERVCEVAGAEPDAIADAMRDTVHAFEDEHDRRYGFRLDQDVELVAVRSVAVVPNDMAIPQPAGGAAASSRAVDVPGLGPATVIDLASGVVFVPPGWLLAGERAGCLLLRHQEATGSG